MGTKKVSMQDIADKLGISKVSVSKAINNQPGISEDLKVKILETSNELGYYFKNNSKTSLLPKKLGFIVPKGFFLENESFYTVIFYYLSKECAEKNISLSLYIINSSDESDLTYPFSLSQDNLNGIFVVGEVNSNYLKHLLKLNLPTVAIDFYKPNINIDCIVTDNFFSSYSLTMHLIDKGHKNIGFVGNPEYTSSVFDRYYGYLKALSQNNLVYNSEWHLKSNDVSGTSFIESPIPDSLPTAFVCHCDSVAYYLILRLNSLGKRVPDDISLVSFDNTELSQACNPPLTTVDINKREFAKKALSQMLYRIKNEKIEPQRIFASTHLIERNSVIKLDT